MLVSGIICFACSVFFIVHYFWFPFSVFGAKSMIMYLINGTATKWSLPIGILGLIYGVACIVANARHKSLGDKETDNMHWVMLASYIVITLCCII